MIMIQVRLSMGSRRKKRKTKFIAIACEGYTEVVYFNEIIKREKKLKAKAECCCVKGEQDPEKFLNKAWEFYKNQVSTFRSLDENKKNIHEDDCIFCVYDLDNKKKCQVLEFEKLAASRGVNTARSDPSFELWFYLHFKDINYDNTCNQRGIEAELKKVWTKYSKGNSDLKCMNYLEVLNEKENNAIVRAVKLREKHSLEASEEVFGVRTYVDGLLDLIKK